MAGPNRREFLRGAAGCAGLALGAPPSARRRANLVVVFADEWRGMDLGCAGHPDVRTPNVDRLAREGVFYESAFANVPVCGPARAMMLTGRYPPATGVLTNGMRLLPRVPTLARVLSAHGYRCAYVGKWHLAGMPEAFVPKGPQRAGFGDDWAVWAPGHRYFDSHYTTDGPEPILARGYAPDAQTDVAIEVLERRQAARRPFCLFLSYGPPHPPYEVPPPFDGMYDPHSLARRPNARASTAEARSDESVRRDLAGYYGACSALDANLGRLLDALDRLELAESTLVVFTSDHGGTFGEHGTFGKQQPFEEAIRVPMIARHPGAIPAGQRSRVLFSLADLAPTLLGYLGVPLPGGIQGSDLSWTLVGSDLGPSSVYLAEYIGIGRQVDHDIFTWRAVRTAGYLYAEDMAGPWLLYDLGRDPYQLVNRVESERHAPVLRRLARELRNWYVRLGESYLTPLEHFERIGPAVSRAYMEVARTSVPSNAHLERYRDYFADGGSWPNRRY